MLRKHGFIPKLQRLDNEASQILLDYMKDQNVDFQLTPAGLHRQNNAERAIHTFKNHFIAGLSITLTNFHLNLSDKLLPQALLTLNILHSTRINPQLSVYAHIHRNVDYTRTPLAPPGINCLAQMKASLCRAWDQHTKDGFYVGLDMSHYQCHNIWKPSTSSTHTCDTVK